MDGNKYVLLKAVEYSISYYSTSVQVEILNSPDTLAGRRIVMLHSFVKKSQKTPRRELEIAERRLKEVKDGHA